MKLPHAGEASVAKSKIADYLLSLLHPYGRTKARFFIQHGFLPQIGKDLKQL